MSHHLIVYLCVWYKPWLNKSQKFKSTKAPEFHFISIRENFVKMVLSLPVRHLWTRDFSLKCLRQLQHWASHVMHLFILSLKIIPSLWTQKITNCPIYPSLVKSNFCMNNKKQTNKNNWTLKTKPGTHIAELFISGNDPIQQEEANGTVTQL